MGEQLKPYYEDDWVTIYHGDSLDMFQQGGLPIVNCTITDPPYCSGAHESARRGKREATTPESVMARPTIQMDAMGSLGYEWTTRRWFMFLRQLTTKGGHLACFTDWRMTPWVQLMMEAAGWRLTNLVVWDKKYPGLGTGFRAQHEFIALGSNGEPVWQSYEFGNVLSSMRLTSTQHPHEKPLDILAKVLQTCSKPGDLILDPFMGSGSTLRAAKNSGRKAIGVEIDEKYCEIAARRMAQEVLAL